MGALQELKEQSQELATFGNSKEQAEAKGMNTVINALEKYIKGFWEYDTYYDSLSCEAQKDINKKFKKLKIY